MYNFLHLKQKIKDIREHLKSELSSIRTGRATPALLDSIRVDSYGSKMPINQIAAISMEDARTLRISPYDISQIVEIEKAITNSNLGVSVLVDKKGIRIFFPELTEEVRQTLAKLVKEKIEKARIVLRRERDNTWADIQKKEKNKEISGDDKFRYKEEMQKIIDDENKNFEIVAEKKEREIKN
ncbi:ribosome recycling factor [Candidatus Campbellbacteria bacterium CG10_big_fil_rev_8_21_14_0_10_35_52]|uniref:Ribosome recycling factor n=1 Tax=Candidatus Campbellbacteria bacterium CG10_big_fil_rev_8_21_14_0_10_35_52 TaxID=1974527 RepID=A0A2M6WVW9_9BACT|nr:MAG: ribosome recycling factor [Candidatus Campbellbacteria bacterium CG10_big_fil_rev_8_21_14_0_10_35_52]